MSEIADLLGVELDSLYLPYDAVTIPSLSSDERTLLGAYRTLPTDHCDFTLGLVVALAEGKQLAPALDAAAVYMQVGRRRREAEAQQSPR